MTHMCNAHYYAVNLKVNVQTACLKQTGTLFHSFKPVAAFAAEH